MAPMTIEVWSDVQCSWCYIGQRRLAAALTRLGSDVTVRHRTFELAPDAPEAFDAEARLGDRRESSQAERRQLLDTIVQTARAEGLDHDVDALQPTDSTLAHQLLHHADDQGRREELAERLYRAYFTEGRHIGRLEELVDLAGEVDLDPHEARRILTDGDMESAVTVDRQRAQRLGIQSVPFYVVNDSYGLSGAQPVEVLLQVLRRVASGQDA